MLLWSQKKALIHKYSRLQQYHSYSCEEHISILNLFKKYILLINNGLIIDARFFWQDLQCKPFWLTLKIKSFFSFTFFSRREKLMSLIRFNWFDLQLLFPQIIESWSRLLQIKKIKNLIFWNRFDEKWKLNI